MSSLRNSLHRRNHKERSQLENRKRLGILEKHKDYVLRAQDYQSKKQRLQLLREKASFRNKDEFYFAMSREKTLRGVHVQDRGNRALPVDIVKALKSQDENYLRVKRARDLKKIRQLRTQLNSQAKLAQIGEALCEQLDEEDVEILSGAGVIIQNRWASSSRKHLIFVEEGESGKRDVKQVNDHQGRDGNGGVDLGWTDAPATCSTGTTTSSIGGSAEDPVGLLSHCLDLTRELASRLRREKLLRYACRELEMQRLLMAKGGRKKLSGVEPVDGDESGGEDEDEDESSDGRKRRSSMSLGVEERAYKPRVYRWQMERKR